jgi:hypothetical protein
MKKLIIIALLFFAASTYSFSYTNSKVYSATYNQIKVQDVYFNNISNLRYYMVVYSRVADNPGGTARIYLIVKTQDGKAIVLQGLQNKPGIDLSSIRKVAYDPAGKINYAQVMLAATYYHDLSFIRFEW